MTPTPASTVTGTATASRRWPRIALAAGLVVAVVVGAVGVRSITGGDGSDDGSGGPPGRVAVEDAWSGPNQSLTAVYFTVTNDGGEDRLVGLATEGAGSSSMMGGGDGLGGLSVGETAAIDVPIPNGTTTLRPGGSHVMLEDLASPLEPGTTIDVGFTFEHAGTVTVPVEIVTWEEAGKRTTGG